MKETQLADSGVIRDGGTMAGPTNGWTPANCRHVKPHLTYQSCYFRSWYEANRESVIERVRDWKQDNRPQHLAGKRRWQKRHGDVIRQAARRLRTRRVGG